MKKIITSIICALPLLGFGQNILLYNDGAIVKVQAGATLYVQGGIQNTGGGTIDNDGIIDLEGNFVNAGTWEPSDPNTLRFSGTGNSDVTSGTAIFQTVEDIKTGGGNVNLLDNMTIDTDLNFNSAGSTRIVTGNFDLKLSNTATVTGPSANEYVATTGTGMMQKGVTANGAFTFPIGDLTNYSPLACTYTGTAYANANLRAKANDLTHPSKPADATDFISRYWDIEQSGISTYNNTLTGTYIPADINGSGSFIKGAVYGAAEWFFFNSAGNGTSTVTGLTDKTVADFTGIDFYGKVNLKAFLDGAYGSGPNMTTNLNSGGWIPPTSPYADAPATVDTSLMPSDITDWIKIELREVGNPSNVLGKTSAFLKNNGTIVGLDFSTLPLIKNGNTSSIVAVFHRNHLPFRTDVGIDCVSPVLIDFTTDTTMVYNNLSNSNDPLLFANGKFQMWSGDVSGSTFLLNSTDVLIVKQQTAVPFTGYSRADVNLSGTGNSTDVLLTKQITAIPKSADL